MTLADRARNLGRHALRMAERVGQALGIADLLAVLYFHEMRNDRFVLSIGHYSIALYAALAEAGVIPMDELDTYGVDGSRLPMSGDDRTPGFEITGGFLFLSAALFAAALLVLRIREKTKAPGQLLSPVSYNERDGIPAAVPLGAPPRVS